MESGLRMGSIRGWPVKAAARERREGRADGIPGSPARALALLEAGTVTGARRARATPAGLRSEGGQDRTPRAQTGTAAAAPSPQRPPVIRQVPASTSCAPGAGMRRCPRTPGATTSGRGPQSAGGPPAARVAPSVPRPSAGRWGLPAATVPTLV